MDQEIYHTEVSGSCICADGLSLKKPQPIIPPTAKKKDLLEVKKDPLPVEATGISQTAESSDAGRGEKRPIGICFAESHEP